MRDSRDIQRERRGPTGLLLSPLRVRDLRAGRAPGVAAAALACLLLLETAPVASAASGGSRSRRPAGGGAGTVAAAGAQADSLWSRLALARWKAASRGEPLRLAPLYPPFEALLAPARIASVRAAESAAPTPAKKRALKNLRRFLEGQSVAAATAALRDSIAAVEWRDSVAVDSVRLPMRELSGFVREEKVQMRRVDAYRSLDGHYVRCRPLYEALLDSARARAASLGYKGLPQFYEEQRGARFAELETQARALLASTQGLYDSSLTVMAGKLLSLSRPRFLPPDLERVRRLWWFDEYFPAESALVVARNSWRALGVDPAAQKNLTLDIREGGPGSPEPGCFPVRIPGDIRVHVRLSGGVEDYMAVQRQIGQAEHHAFTAQPEPGLRGMGSDVAALAMGLFAEHLVGDPAWTGEHFDLDGADVLPFQGQCAFKRLVEAREAAGRFLFQLDMEKRELRPEQCWLLDMRLALRHSMDERDSFRALASADEFACATLLQAIQLEAMLRERLAQKFGPRFYRGPEAGRYLRGIWATGSQLSGPELARRLGYRDLDWGPLVRRLRHLIQKKVAPLSEEEQENS